MLNAKRCWDTAAAPAPPPPARAWIRRSTNSWSASRTLRISLRILLLLSKLAAIAAFNFIGVISRRRISFALGVQPCYVVNFLTKQRELASFGDSVFLLHCWKKGSNTVATIASNFPRCYIYGHCYACVDHYYACEHNLCVYVCAVHLLRCTCCVCVCAGLSMCVLALRRPSFRMVFVCWDEHVQAVQIPSVKYDLDPADPADHTRQTCADHADHTNPTQANMCERSRSYRFHRGKHACKS